MENTDIMHRAPSTIPVESAVESAQQKEDALRNAATELDRDVFWVRDTYSLPLNGKNWLYSEVDEEEHPLNPMAVVIRLIVDVMNADRRMTNLLVEFEALERRFNEMGLLTLPDRIFIRRTLPTVQTCKNKLTHEVALIKHIFDDYKQCIYLLAHDDEFSKALDALRARKLTHESIFMDARPAFRKLVELSHDRELVVEAAVRLGLQQGTAWYGIESGNVDALTLARELKKYDVLMASIQAQKAPHDEAVNKLKKLVADAGSTPSSLPGPYGIELTIEKLLRASNAYEAVAMTCKEALALAAPINDTLDSYIKSLSKGLPIRAAFIAPGDW
ncbi:hypothetical protein GY45DRAFT_1376392 [Cubamyces sp. BRFM 1775]|nr:hypothetical protein GY45DRAFT_1376392 [Cubamyces sp. BRFM 1775]